MKENNPRRDLERAQYDSLCALSEYIQERKPSTLDDTQLEELGVVRWTNLDVDGQSPCKFEPRFFSPCLDEDSGLEEAADRARSIWYEKLIENKHNDPEWVEIVGYIHARVRAKWFGFVLSCLGDDYEGETHPMYVVSSSSASPKITNVAVKQQLS